MDDGQSNDREHRTMRDHLRSNSESVVLGVVAIIIGVFWLFQTMDMAFSLGWLWIICLAIAGLLCIYLGGATRFNVINGLFLLSLAVFAFLRMNGKISWEVEVPSIIVTYGALTLFVTIAWYGAKQPGD